MFSRISDEIGEIVSQRTASVATGLLKESHFARAERFCSLLAGEPLLRHTVRYEVCIIFARCLKFDCRHASGCWEADAALFCQLKKISCKSIRASLAAVEDIPHLLLHLIAELDHCKFTALNLPLAA